MAKFCPLEKHTSKHHMEICPMLQCTLFPYKPTAVMAGFALPPRVQ